MPTDRDESPAGDLKVVTLTQVRWCQVHNDNMTEATYDAATIYGPWAYMCDPCSAQFGVGLGTGRGQRIIYTREGTYNGQH
jgi:hypothetical protein